MRRMEICCTSVNDAIEAKNGGATRIELCTAISCGGVTPSYGLIKKVIESAGGKDGLDVNVLIRASEGNFCYTQEEVTEMAEDIKICRKLGADGIVIGALTPEGDIDEEACKILIKAADGMKMTFHRAFDVCKDPFKALEQIIDMGFDHILTSGQKPTAIEGAGLIAELVKRAAGRIIIMPGSGVNPANIEDLERITGAYEFHSTARMPVPDRCKHRVPELGFDEPSSGSGLVMRTTEEVVRKLVQP